MGDTSMTVLKRILLSVAILALVLVAISFFLPSRAHVERTAVIEAPPDVVFGLVNGFQRFNEFSPWSDLDPQTKYTFTGPATGAGAKMAWTSDDPDVGHGIQQVLASKPNERVDIALEFVGMGKADVQWLLAPDPKGTKATWTFDYDLGANPFMRYIGLTFDGSVGKDYAKGLAKLQKLAAAEAAKHKGPKITVWDVEVPAMTVAYVSRNSAVAEIATTIGAAYGTVNAFLAAHDLQPNGVPLAITSAWDEKTWTFDAGVPVSGPPAALAAARKVDGEVKLVDLPATRALKAEHVGPYDTTQMAYERLIKLQKDQQLTENGRMWEEYPNDPQNTPPEQLVTNVYLPVK